MGQARGLGRQSLSYTRQKMMVDWMRAARCGYTPSLRRGYVWKEEKRAKIIWDPKQNFHLFILDRVQERSHEGK